MSGLLGHVVASAGPPGWAVGFRKRQRFWERPAELLTELMGCGFEYFRKPYFRSWLFQRCVHGGSKLAGDDGSWMEGGLAESRTRTQRVLLSLVPEKLQDVGCLPETVKLWGCTGEQHRGAGPAFPGMVLWGLRTVTGPNKAVR